MICDGGLLRAVEASRLRSTIVRGEPHSTGDVDAEGEIAVVVQHRLHCLQKFRLDFIRDVFGASAESDTCFKSWTHVVASGYMRPCDRFVSAKFSL